jgi:hypothetical protein
MLKQTLIKYPNPLKKNHFQIQERPKQNPISVNFFFYSIPERSKITKETARNGIQFILKTNIPLECKIIPKACNKMQVFLFVLLLKSPCSVI